MGCLALDLLDRRRTALLEDFRPCGVASADRRASRARMRSHTPAYAPADKPVLRAPGLFSFPLPLLFSYRGCRGDFLFSFRFSLKPKRGLLITFPLLITLPTSFRTSLSGVVVWGLGRSPNSKNLCASLCPLCGKT